MQRSAVTRTHGSWHAVCLAAAISCLPAQPASAQSLPGKVFDDFRYGVSDILHVFTFPLRLDGRGALMLGTVGAASGAALLLDDELDRWILAHPYSLPMDVIQPFRVHDSPSLENLGNGAYILAFSGGLYLLGLVFDSRDLRDAGIGCGLTEKAQSMMRGGVFRVVARHRPMVAKGDQYLFDVPGGDWYMRSFFGGHAANIMTCVSFVNHRFDLSVAEPVLMGIAVGVGVGRIADRAHWLSDTIVGAAIGFFMGRAVAHRQLERGTERETRDNGGFFAAHDGTRLMLGWRVRF